MRTKSILAVAAITICGAFSATAQAATPSKVTIKPDAGGFYGKVKSADPDCLEDREVKVYKLTKKGEKYIAMDTTDAEGKYSTGQNGQNKGKFIAKVAKTSECGAAVSKTLKLSSL